MIEPATPADEPYRLAALHALSLLDTPREPDFNGIVELGQALFDVQTCLVTLVDSDRQWFKASVGLEAAETPRAVSFCGHAILQPDVFVVLDATRDERFHDNPLVTGPPHIRFYAGAPIRLPSGYTIGTVCILGPEPRQVFDVLQQQRLAKLAELAITAISVRALRDELDRTRQDSERREIALFSVPLPLALTDTAGIVSFGNESFSLLCDGRNISGVSVTEALGLPLSAWPPAETGDGGLAPLILPSGQQLSVLADGSGFILAAAAPPP